MRKIPINLKNKHTSTPQQNAPWKLALVMGRDEKYYIKIIS